MSNVRRLAEKGVLYDERACIEFLRYRGLLATRMKCAKCETEMKEENTKSAKQDSCRWRCQKKNCRTTTTIRKGSFFENSKAELTKLVTTMYFWADDVTQETMAKESELSKRTMVDWCNFIREVCSEDLIGRKKKIGGMDHVVAIDETHLARRKPATNGQGRPVKAMWLFGGIDLTTKELFVEIIPPEVGSTKEMMEQLIVNHIADGTTIWSDMFLSYNDIENLGRGYTHRAINHSYMYVTPEGHHTQNIESIWADVKRKFKRMNGAPRHLIPSYLDEYLWKRQYPKNEHFDRMLEAISINPRYNVNRKGEEDTN
ncbi:uncharacterized protein LOC144421954 [Styela clava]